jgi:hypothetical protein
MSSTNHECGRPDASISLGPNPLLPPKGGRGRSQRSASARPRENPASATQRNRCPNPNTNYKEKTVTDQPDREMTPELEYQLDNFASIAVSSFTEAVNYIGMGYLKTFMIVLTVNSFTDEDFPGLLGKDIPSNDAAWNRYHLPRALKIMDQYMDAIHRLCSSNEDLMAMMDDFTFESIRTTGMRWMRDSMDHFYNGLREEMDS